jgi:haloalkane dehalogenase
MDTGLFTGDQRMSEAWHRFAGFVERAEELPVSLLVRRGCATDPGDDVAAAYDAPFPSEASKAGARAFPAMLPLSPADPGASAGHDVLRAMRSDTRPTLVLWGAEDRPIPPATGEAFAALIGRSVDHVIEGAGHFLQEDRGAEIGALIAGWLTAA